LDRPRICPFCGRIAEGTDSDAARCPACGASYDLESSFAVGLERIAHQRSMARAILVAGMVWWVVEILSEPTVGSILLPAAISFVAFAEISYLSIAAKRVTDRRERENRSASARLKRVAAEPPAADDDDGADDGYDRNGGPAGDGPPEAA